MSFGERPYHVTTDIALKRQRDDVSSLGDVNATKAKRIAESERKRGQPRVRATSNTSVSVYTCPFCGRDFVTEPPSATFRLTKALKPHYPYTETYSSSITKGRTSSSISFLSNIFYVCCYTNYMYIHAHSNYCHSPYLLLQVRTKIQ